MEIIATYYQRDKSGHKTVTVRCRCGKIKVVREANIKQGRIKTCGIKGCKLGRHRKNVTNES